MDKTSLEKARQSLVLATLCPPCSAVWFVQQRMTRQSVFHPSPEHASLVFHADNGLQIVSATGWDVAVEAHHEQEHSQLQSCLWSKSSMPRFIRPASCEGTRHVSVTWLKRVLDRLHSSREARSLTAECLWKEP